MHLQACHAVYQGFMCVTKHTLHLLHTEAIPTHIISFVQLDWRKQEKTINNTQIRTIAKTTAYISYYTYRVFDEKWIKLIRSIGVILHCRR